MEETSVTLTVLFEAPFWVGVVERVEDGRLSACRIVFGAEPKDYEVWEYVLRSYSGLKFSPAVEAARKPAAGDPKRRRREAVPNRRRKNSAASTSASRSGGRSTRGTEQIKNCRGHLPAAVSYGEKHELRTFGLRLRIEPLIAARPQRHRSRMLFFYLFGNAGADDCTDAFKYKHDADRHTDGNDAYPGIHHADEAAYDQKNADRQHPAP